MSTITKSCIEVMKVTSYFSTGLKPDLQDGIQAFNFNSGQSS